jgi:hypothetical protein
MTKFDTPVLAGQVAVVTGASSGLGRASALALAQSRQLTSWWMVFGITSIRIGSCPTRPKPKRPDHGDRGVLRR